mgnify:FL=1
MTSETGLARGTIYNAKSIASKVAPEVRAVAPSYAHARAVAPLPTKKQQMKVLHEAIDRGLTASQTSRVAQKILRPRIVDGQANLDGRYRVIYADPPWKYANDRAMPDGSLTPSASSYKSMTLEEICACPIEAHAEKNSVLWCWSTNAHLPEGIEVVKAWGFDYKTNFIWNKVKGRPGPYGFMHHETLLIGTRGACTPDVPIRQHDHASIFTEQRKGEHSEKPECARKLITSLYTDGPYLELFGRERIEGWDVFGNDARLWKKSA